MYNITALNKISSKGTNLLTDDYSLSDDISSAEAVLLRSQSMHDLEVPKSLLSVARAGAGVNNIPVDKYAEEGIVVFNTPGANANAVKELTLCALLMSARNVFGAISWASSLTEDLAKTVEKQKSNFAGEEIKGKRLAVIGLGYIGALVANAANDLGMKVMGYDPYINVQNALNLKPSIKLYENIETMLSHADFVTIHVPYMPATDKMLNDDLFNSMNNKAVLLNFSRDKLVDTDAVKRALEDKQLHKYITDFPTDDLVGTPGVFFIPHLGASTKESEETCAIMAVNQTMDYLENGNIINSVNYPNTDAGAKSSKARICVLNKNIPGIIGKLTGILAEKAINISDLVNKAKGDYACTIIDVDSDVDAAEIAESFHFEGIIRVRVL
ncbi:MAG: 3-phosphoglycerate dehydrogenase [Clostridiales Family XIII bacterium]|jgi:D-3-phosphoglycerate dehydrogenase|nr:3-phosphoglycerate dehydrogenase [Clostridiales Family XIII bacterium]